MGIIEDAQLKANEQRKHEVNAQKAAVLDNIVSSQTQAARDSAIANHVAGQVNQGWLDKLGAWVNGFNKQPDGLAGRQNELDMLRRMDAQRNGTIY